MIISTPHTCIYRASFYRVLASASALMNTERMFTDTTDYIKWELGQDT